MSALVDGLPSKSGDERKRASSLHCGAGERRVLLDYAGERCVLLNDAGKGGVLLDHAGKRSVLLDDAGERCVAGHFE